MMLTTREVATALGVTPRRVLAIAKARGVKGRRVGTAWLWPARAVEEMKPGPRGRPRTAD